MLRPSYAELMEVLNKEKNMDMKITSRYTIVIAAAKRARQLIDGGSPLSKTDSDKPVSLAINEMYEGKLKISVSKDAMEECNRKTNDSLTNEDYINQDFLLD